MKNYFSFMKPAALVAAMGFAAVTAQAGSEFIYLWTGDIDLNEGSHDFLATVNVNPDSDDYGKVVATTIVPDVGTMPHHIEPEIARDGTLFASGFMANKIYLFDMNNAAQPTLIKTISEVPGWSMSHSFIRRPDNNKMIATLQYKMGDKSKSGGLAIFNTDGSLDSSMSVSDPAFDKPIRSYGLDVAPLVDRLITTSTPMAMEEESSDVVQIFRLSDMELLHTVAVPVPADDPSRGHHPFEIRVLPDGKSAMLNTFQCGFFVVDDIETDNPTVEMVYALKKPNQRACSVPSIVGNYWVMPVQMADEVVVLDISDLTDVKEVFNFKTDKGFMPHYSMNEPGSNRIALTGFMGKDARVMMMLIDTETGALSWDETFRDTETGGLGVNFSRASWPHGDTGPAMPHGIVWSLQ